MTAGKLQKVADAAGKKYDIGRTVHIARYHADGYIAGWKACESSPEYKELRDGDDNFSLIQEAVQKWRDEYVADAGMKTDEAMAKLGWLIASTMEIL